MPDAAQNLATRPSPDFAARYGPWAIVAGASEGLGAAWAEALAQRGLNLILLARREDVLAHAAQALRSRHPVEIATQAVDLGAADLLQTLAPTLAGRDVGLYVHNAAFAPHGEFLRHSAAEQLASLDVNCRAPLLLAHHLGGQMAERGKGGIVLMSSLTAFQGTPLLTTYGATKAFNLVLAEGLHTEFKTRGVDVLACCAGATRTPGFLRVAPDGAPGQLEPDQVVTEALHQLGRRRSSSPARSTASPRC
jgi:short-subunit dehydrogenase